MSSISSTYTKTQFLNDFSASTIAVDDNLLNKVGENMSKAGLSQTEIATVKKELVEVAGEDKIIQGAEFDKLFTKLDGHDKNGSSSSFLLKKSAGGVASQTLCGNVVDTLLQNRTTTTNYSVADFQKEFGNGEVNVGPKMLADLFQALGREPYSLSVSERTKVCKNIAFIAGINGKISGAELNELFKEIKSYDNGSKNDVFTVSTATAGKEQGTVSGEILNVAKDNFAGRVDVAGSALKAEFAGGAIKMSDIGIMDCVHLAALGVNLLDLAKYCDGKSSSMDGLISMLDTLDGQKDQKVNIETNYLNGRANELTKTGKALNILRKYLKGSADGVASKPAAGADQAQPATGSSQTKPVADNPASISGSNVVCLDDNIMDVIAGGGTAAKKLIADIKANRATIDQTRVTIKRDVTYGGTVRKNGNMYGGIKTGTPTAVTDGTASKQQQAVISELTSEGGWTSINTYDNQVFTFGRGFAAFGTLPQLLEEWFQDDNIANEFKKYGVTLNGTHIQVVDTEKGKVVTDKEAYQYIKEHIELQYLFVNIGEDPEYIQSLIDAQYTVLSTDGACVIPGFAANWEPEACQAAAHIQHWLPAIGWKTNNSAYKKCQNSVDVVRTAYTLMGKAAQNGKKWIKSGFSSINSLNSQTFVLNNSIGASHISHWGGGEVWKDVKALAGASIAISNADITAGKYSGKILIADPKANGKYYVLNQM